MTKEIFESLDIYEDLFTKAINDGFIRSLGSSHASFLHNTFFTLFGTTSGILGGCSRCVLRDVKRIGEEYFKYKESHTVETVEEPVPQPLGGTTITMINVEEPVVETEVIEEPKKRGRKKKENNDETQD